jgi:hypothetical protein
MLPGKYLSFPYPGGLGSAGTQELRTNPFSGLLLSDCRCRIGGWTAPGRHRAAGRDVKPFPATQSPAAEIPAGGRPGVVDGTAPRLHRIAIRHHFFEVLARGRCKKIPGIFKEPTGTEIVELVGFALLDRDQRQPAATFSAAVAGAGLLIWSGRNHTCMLAGKRQKGTG